MSEKMRSEFYMKFKDMQKLKVLDSNNLKKNIFIKQNYKKFENTTYMILFLKFIVEDINELELKIDDLKII